MFHCLRSVPSTHALSRVFTDQRTHESRVVCTSCGATFAYDWQRMAVGQRIAPEQPREWKAAEAAQ